MYAAFGVASPFMPAFFEARGLAPTQLGASSSAPARRSGSSPGHYAGAWPTCCRRCAPCSPPAPRSPRWSRLACWPLRASGRCWRSACSTRRRWRPSRRSPMRWRCARRPGGRPRAVRVRVGARNGLGRVHRRHAPERPDGRRLGPRLRSSCCRRRCSSPRRPWCCWCPGRQGMRRGRASASARRPRASSPSCGCRCSAG